MNRKYRMVQYYRRGGAMALVSLVPEDDSSFPAGVCAGGNRVAVGPRGTAPAGEAAIVTGYSLNTGVRKDIEYRARTLVHVLEWLEGSVCGVDAEFACIRRCILDCMPGLEELTGELFLE